MSAFEHLSVAISAAAVDVVGVDVFHWGGFANVWDSINICRAFRLDLFGHCTFDLGVTTAANLHTYSALTDMKIGFDTIGYLQNIDIICEKLAVSDRYPSVSEGPGLGVSLGDGATGRYSVERVCRGAGPG